MGTPGGHMGSYLGGTQEVYGHLKGVIGVIFEKYGTKIEIQDKLWILVVTTVVSTFDVASGEQHFF